MKTRLLLATLAAAFAVAGCSQDTPESSTTASSATHAAAQLDEAGLVASVGSPVVQEYKLDDGRGLSFRSLDCSPTKCEPTFSLEFRGTHTNLAWGSLSDSTGALTAKLDAMNAENIVWARRVITHALGAGPAEMILANAERGEPLRGQVIAGKKVGLSPGKMQNLLQIIH